jgi:hypothetical protein
MCAWPTHVHVQVGGELRGGELAEPERAPEPPVVQFGQDQPAG